MLLADRNNADLSSGHPERESAFVVLDQDTHKSLEGSENRAVDNDRLLLEAVAVAVCKTEVMRQLEVELYSAALPLASERVLDLEVDLRTVECAVALVDLVVAFTVLVVQNALKGCFGAVPHFNVSHEIIRACGQLTSVCDAECCVDLVSDIHDISDLRLDLGLHDECMAVILTECLYAEETVQLAGFLLAMNDIELIVADRQFLVGVNCSLVCHHCVRAVHRLCCKYIRIVLTDLFPCHRRNNEHIVLIMCPVAGNEPELSVVDDRSGNLIISVARMDRSPVSDESLVDFPAVRQPVRHARRCLIEHEEIQFRTQLLVVALHSLAYQIEVCFQLLLVRKCVEINSLQRIAAAVSSPVSTGSGFDLVSRLHQLF